MKVRAAALRRFGENNIREGAPMATIEEVLVPIYMYHRYQVEAAAKVIGGQDYTFSVKGKGDRNPQIVSPEEQRRALAAVLETLKPEALAVPESLLRLIPPRPSGYPRTREDFRIRTQPVFDALAPAEAVADHVSGFLLNQERAARLVQFHARDPRNPGLAEVIDRDTGRDLESACGDRLRGRDPTQRRTSIVLSISWRWRRASARRIRCARLLRGSWNN